MTQNMNNQAENENNRDVQVVSNTETYVMDDGSQIDVAVLDADGQQILLVDENQDGVADVAMADLNNNGILDEGEMVDLQGEGVLMPEKEAPTPGVELVDYGTVTNADGSQMDVAVLDVEGQTALVVDVDQNGTADFIASDLNNDGILEDNEIFDIQDENIAMSDFIPTDDCLA